MRSDRILAYVLGARHRLPQAQLAPREAGGEPINHATTSAGAGRAHLTHGRSTGSGDRGQGDPVSHPRAWLERFSSYHLWTTAQRHRSIAAFLAGAIRRQDSSRPFREEIPRDRHTDFPNCCPSIHGPLPAVITEAFLEKCRAYPHIRPISEAIKADWIPEARKELDSLLEQARSRHTTALETAEANRLVMQ